MSQPNHDPSALIGASVTGGDGEKIGKIDDIFLDNTSSQPEWAAVKSGLFGGHVSLMPLARSEFDGEQLQVPFSKNDLKDAPHHDPGEELTPEQENELYVHYEIDTGRGADRETPRSDADTRGQHSAEAQGRSTGAEGEDHLQGGSHGRPEDEPRGQGHDTSGPNTDEAMTRSEEQLHVGTQQQETGRARLRKYVVTENVTKTVPVSHEEVRVEREPITDANREAAISGAGITEEEHEITLHEERATVQKETVPVERVRLGTETVTGEETVTEQVRKEQIDDPDVTDGQQQR